jgi:alanine racemase
MQRFDNFIQELEKEGINIEIKHCSNSAGIIEFREAYYSSVRAGISLYGLYPSKEVDQRNVNLKQVITLKSHVIFLKRSSNRNRNQLCGTYGNRQTDKVATIPVGLGMDTPEDYITKVMC